MTIFLIIWNINCILKTKIILDYFLRFSFSKYAIEKLAFFKISSFFLLGTFLGSQVQVFDGPKSQ